MSGENAGPPPAAAAGNALAARQAQAAALAKLQAHGEELFNQRCKSCHMPPVEHAPSRSELAAQFPNVIIDALKTGKMQAMAAGLSETDIGAIASWVTGQAPDAKFDLAGESRNACPAGAKFNPAGPSWNGWSPDKQNTRVAASTTITAANVAEAGGEMGLRLPGRPLWPADRGRQPGLRDLVLRPGLCAGQADRLRGLELQGARQRAGHGLGGQERQGGRPAGRPISAT